jgi:hypothetical protein
MKPFPKTLLILITLLTLAQTAFAGPFGDPGPDDGEPKEPLKPKMIGIRGGVQVTAAGPFDWSFGWHAGAVMDIAKLTEFELLKNDFGIYVQPGVYFLTRQSIWKKDTYWLEIPVLLSVRRQPKSSKGLFSTAYRFELGPYVNIGMLGDYEDILVNKTGEDQEDQMSRYDVGISFTAGYELGVVWIYSSYSRGFVNVSDYYDSSTSCWKIIGIGVNF